MPSLVPPHPGASSPQVSARMSLALRRDTAPELALRRALHAAGYRYRVVHPVPGNRRRSIDIAFTRARVAVFVDGCFWHGCPEHGSQPRANSVWWAAKLAANHARDQDTDRLLREAGWQVVRVWEHARIEDAVAAVRSALEAGGPTGRR
ncbi:very short patch repair endonuclease [Ornithinimicrobium avium]|uniref:Very short patch repair endonuclease n=2 Tax=Ornithinimicrobium avium TaxID=2283195 RepID=A0A345NL14_9MICO|nr:very short patch repair endonuclease [Ornithinimicrobium avium]